MTIRILGACFILLGCGSFGFLIAGNARREIFALRNLISAIDYMMCDLRCKSTPLPELCTSVAKTTKGTISRLFKFLAQELETKVSANVSTCMSAAISNCGELPTKTLNLCELLGQRMGVFDLDGQVRTLDSLRLEAEQMLKVCEEGHDMRSRSYKTIAVCAGAAIVILLV